MIIRTMSDAKKALKVIQRENQGKRIHYPVMFKKALMIFREKQDHSVEHLVQELEMNHSTVWNWSKQHEEGLYEADAVYAVSKKSRSLNHSVLETLHQQVAEMQEKIKVIEAAEAMGLKVVEA